MGAQHSKIIVNFTSPLFYSSNAPCIYFQQAGTIEYGYQFLLRDVSPKFMDLGAHKITRICINKTSNITYEIYSYSYGCLYNKIDWPPFNIFSEYYDVSPIKQ